MITVENMPASVRERVVAAHSEQHDHAFDCLGTMLARVAELVGEGTPIEVAIRRAAVDHSKGVRWVRDNVGLD
jgi:hypothetical protein